MLALARTGVAEGAWLRAERQRSGRGRMGREWVSPVGNFYGSTVVRLRPTDPAAPTLALLAAVALEETVSTYIETGEGRGPGGQADAAARTVNQLPLYQLGPGLRRGTAVLKWPNDLLLGGAKLSGILLERAEDAVVIGIGVNLAHHPDLADRPTTSLAAHDTPVDPAQFAETLAETFTRWLTRWRSEGLGPVRQRWLDRAHPIGTALTARLPDGTAHDGLFDGLDADGALILRLADGQRRVIHAADVFLI
jgi:BirA family biotin operon repressor/biotin-[acetyl-CoA-carboxylase] ligase